MTGQRHILVVDDEADLVELVTYNLTKGGYRATSARTGRSAIEAAITSRPDLIILDVMLPELPGTEVASRLRTNPATADIPILMLTAKGEELDQIVGLTVGADDYVTKPFSMKVLMARVEALLRRSAKAGSGAQNLRLGPVEVDTATHEVRIDGKSAAFTLTEFRLLASLVQAGGRVLSRERLMARAMGPGVTVTERTIDVHMTSIRKKLGPHAGLIRTVRGVGYRATPEPEGSEAEQV